MYYRRYILAFLIDRRPTASPLFPYTTLFRSKSSLRATKSVSQLISTSTPIRPPPWLYDTTAAAGSACWSRSTARPDRKSTRLNSSHSSNSYAVFFLETKNFIDIPADRVDDVR